MDTHVATGPVLDDSSTLRARLPGEPDDGLDVGDAAPPLHAEKREAPPRAASKRRSGLLSGVAIIAVVVIAGGGFLVSPYNTVVPVPPAMRLAALHAETRVQALLGHHTVVADQGARSAPAAPSGNIALHTPAVQATTTNEAGLGVIAPSAALAPIHAPAPPTSVVQPPYKAAPQNTEISELLNLQRAEAAPAAAPSENAPHVTSATPDAEARSAKAVQSAGTRGSEGVSAVPAKSAGTSPALSPHQVAALQSAAPPPGYVPHEPGVVESPASPSRVSSSAPPAPLSAAPIGHGAGSEPPSAVATQPSAKAPLAVTKPPTAPPAAPAAQALALAQPMHTVSVGPGDALAASPKLQAAPMAPEQQIQVLELVTQLATLIRDQRTQIANLQADVQSGQKATSAKLGDFERRLALVEAGTALAAASGSQAPSSVAPTAASGGSATTVALTSAKAALAAASSPSAPPAPAAAPQAPATPEQYRVQAASPGLAMLAEVDHSGGDGAQQQVQVGDTLPGYGRVLSVSQQGTSWVVKTEHGTIQ